MFLWQVTWMGFLDVFLGQIFWAGNSDGFLRWSNSDNFVRQLSRAGKQEL